MLKKKISFALSLVMTVGILSGCAAKSETTANAPAAAAGDVIKIGVVAPLTGDTATFGQSTKNALQILEEETNKGGGLLGKQVKFIYEDDEGKPASAATVAKKLITNDKVVGIVGSVTSGCSNAIGPIAVQNKIPMISGTATDAKVTKAGEYVFRACFIDPFQGTVLSKFASENLKAKTAAVLYDNGNDYSKGLAEAFKKGFEASGGKIVAYETYNKGEQDFNAQLTKIKPSTPDVLILPDYYTTVGLIAKQARALGIKSVFMGGDGWDSSKLYEIGGDALKGAYFSNHYAADDTSAEVAKFKKSYDDKYKAVPDALAVLAYDAATILLNGIKTAGKTDGESVKDAMKKTDLTVVSGNVKFDANRDAIKAAVMIEIQDGGKFKFAAKVNP